MKIVAVSDTHRNENQLKINKCDIFIHAGDTDTNDLKDLIKLNNWFGTIESGINIYVPGNHDFIFEKNLPLSISTLTNAKVLLDNQIIFKGIKIWGSPWQPWFHNWAFNLPRGKALKEKWALIPDDINILITHGPPEGILDRVFRTKERVGCADLAERVREIKPKYHIFGHIHEGYGVEETTWDANTTRSKKTIFINASQANDRNVIVNSPIEFEYESGRT